MSYIQVKITEKATGRIVTHTDPDDAYYPFETEQGSISSVGYAEICCISDTDAVRRAGVVSESRDTVLTAEQLCGIYDALDSGDDLLGAFVRLGQGMHSELTAEWLAEMIPDPADRDMLTLAPELYSFEYILEDHNI